MTLIVSSKDYGYTVKSIATSKHCVIGKPFTKSGEGRKDHKSLVPGMFVTFGQLSGFVCW